MNDLLIPEYESFLDRVESGLSKTLDMTKVPDWIIKNTRNPTNKNLRWSFAEHEFQIGILADAAPHVVIRKCSQVGMTEAAIRLTLAVCYMRDLTGIYVLPNSNFVRKVSSGRIDPIVENSPTLSSRRVRDSYSVSMKRIADMTLYISGAFTDSEAISVPAQFLVRDEYDFAKQTVLSKFDSRLGHSKEGEDFRRDFSTPTVAGYGIDNLFQQGTQAYYAVKHDSCGKWVVPVFMDDVVVPGFDGTPKELEKYHLTDSNIHPDDAYVRCPSCRRPITISNLSMPNKRMWVPSFADREIHSYQVQPFDVPTINPPSRTIKQLAAYKLKRDWINFKVGDVAEDASSSFNPSYIETYKSGTRLNVEEDGTRSLPIRMGVDQGAISWIYLFIPTPDGRLQMVHIEQVRCRGIPDALYNRVVYLVEKLGLDFGVIDAMPDHNTAFKICAKYPGKFLACEYVQKMSSPLQTLDAKPDRMIVKAHRTKRFDLLVADYSNGRIRWCSHPELPVMEAHLQGMKKVKQMSSEDADVESEGQNESWETLSDDHYLHAMGYAHMADELAGTLVAEVVSPSLPLPGKARVGAKHADKETAETDALSSFWAARGAYGRRMTGSK